MFQIDSGDVIGATHRGPCNTEIKPGKRIAFLHEVLAQVLIQREGHSRLSLT
jgi:hypothetical protein